MQPPRLNAEERDVYLAYAIVLVLLLTFDLKRAPRFALPAWVAGDAAFAFALVASLASFLLTLFVDAHGGERTWQGVPLPFSEVGIPHTDHPLCSDVSTIAAVVQTLALFVCWARLGRAPLSRAQTIAVCAGIGVSLCFGFAVPALGSGDIYAYAGYTLLADPYRLQHEHFAPAFRAVESVWSYPMIPSVYGPLWTALSHAAAGSLPTLRERLYALRALAIVAFAFVAFAYARLRDTPTALVLLAANPALVDQYVVDAHNDLWGIGFVLLALSPGARTIVRVALLVAAGSIKLPLILPAAVVFANARSLAVRILAPCAAVGIALAIAFALHADASRTVALQTGYRSILPGVAIAHYVLGIVCVALVAIAVLWGRFARFGGFSTVALGINPNPWYLGWGFPYAIAARQDRAFLIAFPVVASLADSAYDATPLRLLVGVAIFAVVFTLAIREIVGKVAQWRAPGAARAAS